jgi:hypothetical protein
MLDFNIPTVAKNGLLLVYIRKDVSVLDKRQSGARWSTQSSAPNVGPMKKSRGSEC